MSTLLLHVFHPERRPADQVETWQRLRSLEARKEYRVLHYPTIEPMSYVWALEAVWDDPGDVIVIEQDIVPSWAEVHDLEACGEDFCSFDFNLANGVSWTSITGGIGLGCAKIGWRARLAVREHPPVPQHAYPDTVHMLPARLPPVHVHRPMVRHNHYGD